MGALIACIPLIPWFWLLLVLFFCRGLAEGLLNTGGNTLLVWTHGEKVSPFMNGLHFCFGLGAFLSPLLVAQLTPLAGGYRWAYWVLAIFAVLAGLRMFTLRGSPQPRHDNPAAGSTSAASRPYLPLIGMATLFLFFYVGAEIAYGNWIYTYTTTLGIASEASAAYLNAAFWLSFTIGRFISIPIATRFTPRQVVPAALAGGLALLAVMMMMIPGSTAVLWGVTIGLGFCMAPVWPTGFTLAGQMIPMTAFASGLILAGDSLGGMVLPSLAGLVIKTVGIQAIQFSLPLLVFGSLAGTALAFGGDAGIRPPQAMKTRGTAVPNAHAKAIGLALLVTFLWATSWVLIKIGLKASLPAVTFAGLRYSLAFACLAPFVAFNPAYRQIIRNFSRAAWVQLAALGLIFYTLTQGAQFVSLAFLPAATLTLLLNCSPIVVALLSLPFTHETPSRGQWAGIGLSVLGALVYFFPLNIPAGQYAGLAAAVVGVLANSGAALLGRQVNHSSRLPPVIVTTISMGIGGLLLLGAGAAFQGFGRLDLTQWLIIAWLAVVNTAIAFTLWNKTLQTLTAVESSIINGTMLPQIALLAWLFLGEPLTLRQIIGLVLVGAGTLVVQLRRRSP